MLQAPIPSDFIFNARNLNQYADTMARGIEHLTSHVESVSKPFSGTSVEHLTKYVDNVDLDVPLRDTGAALEEMSRLYLSTTPSISTTLRMPPTSTALWSYPPCSPNSSSPRSTHRSTPGTRAPVAP